MNSENTTKDTTPAESDNSPALKLFKYCTDDENVIRGIFLDERIRFTQPAALNDPLEFNPVIRFRDRIGKYTRYLLNGVLFPSYQEWISHYLIFTQVDAFGILSLTTKAESFDMWSRYANGHQGFLLEFKAGFNKHQCMRGRNGEIYEVCDVIYMPDYSWDVEDLVDKKGNIYRDEFNSKLFSHKSSRWGDEDEWRMVRPLADHKWWVRKTDFARRDREKYLFPFSLDCIQSVTFGACMSPQNKRKIAEACKGRIESFFQAMIVKDGRDSSGRQGIVMRNAMEHVDRLYDLPDTCVMCEGWSDGEPNEAPGPPVAIKSLSEIPYCAGDEERVQRYYRTAKSGRL